MSACARLGGRPSEYKERAGRLESVCVGSVSSNICQAILASVAACVQRVNAARTCSGFLALCTPCCGSRHFLSSPVAAQAQGAARAHGSAQVQQCGGVHAAGAGR